MKKPPTFAYLGNVEDQHPIQHREDGYVSYKLGYVSYKLRYYAWCNGTELVKVRLSLLKDGPTRCKNCYKEDK